ncbi:MAG: CRISPR-associated endonuclease Cas1 [Kiritimatiellae bacterium]|nr:CRISPR-associated endonuclease Cas1 [Kiritimatiellia bacterium]
MSRRLEVTSRIKDGDGERTVASQVPLFDIDRVIVVGEPAFSMPALMRLADEGIPVFFVSKYGKWRGSLLPDNNLNAGRRIRQYEQVTNPDFGLKVARRLVYAKLKNSRRVLQRMAANRGLTNDPAYQQTDTLLRNHLAEVQTTDSLDVLRGIEGIGAAWYFRALGKYFPAALPFTERNRRPPKDPANALLSWSYTILMGEMETAIRSHGLDAGIGCLHCDKLSSPSLALDLMEPLRPAIADLLVLNMVNHSMVKSTDHFEFREDGGVYLNADGRRAFFSLYEQTMLRRFTATKGDVHTDFRKVIDGQVCEYLRALELNEEPQFFILP